jgi:hypothetical protein
VIRTSTLQNLPLEGLVQGVNYLLVLTGANQTSTLKFNHLNDPTPRDHPSHTAKVAAGAIITEFICPSPDMTLSFAIAPATYYLTVVPVTSPEF